MSVLARLPRPVLVAGWWSCAVATIATGVVVGYGSVWLQFFGDTADRGDYLVSVGGYGAAAGVLLVAAGGIPRHGGRGAARVLLVVTAVVFGALAARSAGLAGPAERAGVPNGPLDGIGGVLACPWVWVLVACSVRSMWSVVSRGEGRSSA